VERILHLKKVPVLSDIAAEDVAVLAEHVQERFFPEGSVLMREREPISSVYLIVDGLVHCSRHGRPLGDVGPGDGAVGGLAVFARDVDGMDARARTDVLCLEIETDTLVEILEDRFAIAHQVLRFISTLLLGVLMRHPRLLAGAQVVPRHPAIPDQDLNLVERLLFVRQSPAFAQTSLNALAALSRAMVEVSFPAGTTLWQDQEPAGTVLLIVSGSVSAVFPSGERFSLGAGMPLGALEAQAGRPHWYTAIAETKVVALRGDIQGLVDIMEDNFPMTLDTLAVLSRWLLAVLERTSDGDLRSFFGALRVASGAPVAP
jgi:CRP-like cAMP-binding protein